jgi:hypothetical protein
MTRPRLVFALIVAWGAAPVALAQRPAPSASPGQADAPTTPAGVRLSDPYMPAYSSQHGLHRTRTAPQPPPRRGEDDSDYGFRNPGGIGRYSEYYPPGNQFQSGRDPVRVASFDNGPASHSFQSQMQAQMVGNARTRTLNQHIDNYSSPMRFGWGFGFGGFGGGFPY